MVICPTCRLPVSADATEASSWLRAAILAAKAYRNLVTMLPVSAQALGEMLAQLDDQIEFLQEIA